MHILLGPRLWILSWLIFPYYLNFRASVLSDNNFALKIENIKICVALMSSDTVVHTEQKITPAFSIYLIYYSMSVHLTTCLQSWLRENRKFYKCCNHFHDLNIVFAFLVWSPRLLPLPTTPLCSSYMDNKHYVIATYLFYWIKVLAILS